MALTRVGLDLSGPGAARGSSSEEQSRGTWSPSLGTETVWV